MGLISILTLFEIKINDIVNRLRKLLLLKKKERERKMEEKKL